MGICCMCIAVKREAAIENIQRSEKEKNITVRDVIREKKGTKCIWYVHIRIIIILMGWVKRRRFTQELVRRLVGKDFLKILIIVCNK